DAFEELLRGQPVILDAHGREAMLAAESLQDTPIVVAECDTEHFTSFPKKIRCQLSNCMEDLKLAARVRSAPVLGKVDNQAFATSKRGRSVGRKSQGGIADHFNIRKAGTCQQFLR